MALCLLACAAGTDPTLPPPSTVHPSFKADIPPPLESGRLPGTARPRRCAIDLDVDPAADWFRGDVYIDVELPRPTSAIVLHGSGLTISRAEIIGRTGRVRAEASFRKAAGSPREAEELLLLPLSDVPAGEAVLHIEYTAPLGDTLRGLYRVTEGGQSYVFTQFEPSDARRMMPCFDDPAYKIPYTVRVTVPRGNLVFSNARERGRLESEDGKRSTFTFATTPPLPTYLLAIAAGPFEVREGPASSVPVRLVATKGKTRLGGYALDAATTLLEMFGTYFDRPYPYEKLDLVAVPNFAPGAMENAGLVTFREELVLVDPDVSSAQARRSVASVMAHELAHQWFGNLVTMRWWDDLWLNEGFATHVEAWALDRWQPNMHAGLDLLSAIGDVMDLDALDSVRIVRQPVANTYQAQEAFDGITYLKGAAVLGMLRHWLGEEDFQKGVRAYLREHEWGNAASDDLLRALSKASGKNVEVVASGFLERQGVPVVNAKLVCEAGRAPRVELRQARYRARPRKAAKSRTAPWTIPVCIEYALPYQRSSRQQCDVLAGRTGSVELDARRCPSWINPNGGYRGYYRYSMPADQVADLRRAARGFGPREQVGFLSNTWAMVRAGELPADELLKALSITKRSSQRLVVEESLAVLRRVSHSLVEKSAREAFRAYAASLLLAPAKRFGWDVRHGDTDDDKLMRRSLLSALALLTEERWLVQGAVQRAGAFLHDPKSVDPDTAAIALRVAARHGEPTVTVDALLAALTRAETPEQRTSITPALGSFRNPQQARRAFDLILGKTVRAQDAMAIARAAAANSDTRALYLSWLERHFAEVVDKYPGFAASRMLAPVGKLCNRRSRDAAARTFMPLVRRLGRGKRRLREALERADLCISLRQRQAGAVSAYLRSRQ